MSTELHGSGVVGHVDLPSSVDVVAHNGNVVRVRGWAVSGTGRPAGARYRLGRGPWVDVPATLSRPDVFDAVGSAYGLADDKVGFDFYVDLPDRKRRGVTTIDVALSDGTSTTPRTRYRILEPDGSYLETYVGASPAKEALAAKHLEGRGVEFGALHQPLKVDPARAEVRFADRLAKADALATFPELRDDYGEQIVDPDYLIDLDLGDLSAIEEEAFDFFIANDVIEHLANPLRFLEVVHDVMRPGSKLFLSAPDLSYTFDVGRAPVDNDHLWREYEAAVTRVDDEHIRAFIEESERSPIPDEPDERARLFESHRERSVHVHAWDQAAFDAFLEFAIDRLGLSLRVIDAVPAREACGSMAYVLERT